MTNNAICTTAIDDIEKRLECLVTSDGTPVKLVNFSHQSPGLIKLRRQIAEALILVIEDKHSIIRKS